MKKYDRVILLVTSFFLLVSCQLFSKVSTTPHPISLPVEITDAKGVTMRLVPAGDFTMGTDSGVESSTPAHTVTLSDYYMDVYEVTRGSYKECVSAGVCSEVHNVPVLESFYAQPSYPMADVPWGDASTYCQWRDARLPTEAEWEKAARGTDGRTYPWGEELGTTHVEYGLSAGPSEVGAHPENISPYGMYDMAGNLWEWTADPFLPYPGYQGDESYFRPADRVLRGGSSYGGDEHSLSTWFRYASAPETEVGYIGFRCARGAAP